MLRDLRVFALGLLVAGAGCAQHVVAAGDAGESKPGIANVRVHVSNHYLTEMEILVTGSGTAHRLGLVAPGLERDFELPQVVVVGGAATFRAHQPSGFGPYFESEEVRIRPGNVIDFQIATNLLGSRAMVRP